MSTLFFDFEVSANNDWTTIDTNVRCSGDQSCGKTWVAHASGPALAGAIAHFPNAQHLPTAGEYLKRLFRRDAPSTALSTGYPNTRAACATNHHVPKSKELASCLASS